MDPLLNEPPSCYDILVTIYSWLAIADEKSIPAKTNENLENEWHVGKSTSNLCIFCSGQWSRSANYHDNVANSSAEVDFTRNLKRVRSLTISTWGCEHGRNGSIWYIPHISAPLVRCTFWKMFLLFSNAGRCRNNKNENTEEEEFNCLISVMRLYFNEN